MNIQSVRSAIALAVLLLIVTGVNAQERVVIGSPSEFRPGEHVAPKVVAENKEGQF